MRTSSSGSPVSPRASTPSAIPPAGPDPTGKIQFYVSEFHGMNPRWHQETAFIDDDALWQLKEDGNSRLIVSFNDVTAAKMEEHDGVFMVKVTAAFKDRKPQVKRSLSSPVIDLLTGHNGRRMKEIILSSPQHADANFIYQRCLMHMPIPDPAAAAAAPAGHAH